MLVLCLVLAKKRFHQFLLSVLKMNDTVDFEDIFCTLEVVIKPEFPFRVCNTDCNMPGFDKQFIFNNSYSVV